MSKKQKALNEAKKSWKEVIKWWKEFWKWWVEIVWWTAWALGYTLLSGWEKVASKVSEFRGNDKWLSSEEIRSRINKAAWYNKDAKKHIVKAWDLGKMAISWAWKVVRWWAKALWYWAKAGYHLIDAWDKAIWEQIEKRQLKKWKKAWKITSFFRDNILKLLIAAWAAWYWGYKISEIFVDDNEDKIEILKPLDEKEQNIKDFFTSPDVMKDFESSGKDWEKKWEDRYLWKDDAWNNMKNGFGFAERKKVIEWMCRLIESWHLEMVIKKADEAWVPRQCVFLALAESWWQAWANSGVAWWYWQFTKQSAKDFGAIDKNWNDYRSDPEKSTDAAMKHLKENYKIVCNYAKQLWYKLSESDKWILAFHMYNWSPKLVRKWMVACKWDVNKYPDKQVNWENRNYGPRILAIQNVLQEIFKKNWYDTQKVRSTCLNQKKIEKTQADLMYEDFIKEAAKLTQKQKLQRLNEVKAVYKKEYEEWIITKIYYEWAIRVIGEAIIWETRDDEDAEE